MASELEEKERERVRERELMKMKAKKTEKAMDHNERAEVSLGTSR